jgi:hypothetical protein
MPEQTGRGRDTLEAMKRTALVSAICAIVTCWLAVAPASAATGHPAQATTKIKRLGRHCTTVHSDISETRTAVICVYVDINSSGKPRATVTFSTKSGTLSEITITTLKLLVNGHAVRVRHNIRRFLTGSGTVFDDGWWDGGGDPNMLRIARRPRVHGSPLALQQARTPAIQVTAAGPGGAAIARHQGPRCHQTHSASENPVITTFLPVTGASRAARPAGRRAVPARNRRPTAGRPEAIRHNRPGYYCV